MDKKLESCANDPVITRLLALEDLLLKAVPLEAEIRTQYARELINGQSN